VLLFFAVLWSLSFLLNAEYAGFYFKIGYQLFLGSIPCYILARCVKDYALLKKYLNITSIFIALATLVLIDRLRTNTLDDFNYSQKIGYFVLPAAIISVSVLYEKLNFLHLANACLSTFLIIFAGARGPVVCLILFIATKSILKVFFGGAIKKIAVFFTTGLFITAVYSFWDRILSELQAIVIKFGLSQRIVAGLMENVIFEDDAREALRNASLKFILDNPFWGTGIAQDRLVLADITGKSPSEAIGWYSHNIFLEISMQFGLLIGIAIIIALIYFIIASLLKSKDNDLKDIICIFLAIGFFPLLFSGSYLTRALFFSFIGFCMSVWVSSRVKN
jgi:hypothetical protein